VFWFFASSGDTLRILVAASLSGVLLVFSFPSVGHPAIAWVALCPLLLALHSTRSLPLAFGIGMVTGVIQFGGTLSWLAQVMVEFGGLPLFIGWALNALLVAYLALFPGVFALTLVALQNRFGGVVLMGAAPVWLTTELGRMWLFGGFPWELIGYSQTSVLSVAQFASLFGVHGLTLLVVLVNSALAFALVGSGPWRFRVILTTFGLLSAVVLFGLARLADNDLLSEGEPLTVGLIQGNVPQQEKWNPLRREEILNRYINLSRQSSVDGAQLIIWPESATPFSFEEHPAGEMVRRLARDTGVHVLFGSTRIQGHRGGRLFNAAFMLDQRGDTVGVYHKMHLVPFGEYVPFRRFLPFASPLVETMTEFSPGRRPEPLPIDSHLTSAAICYEIIYPSLAREFVRNGSELLTTITNDAWYGRSAAPYQHFQQARMRAIEQGRYLVRAANTGISGIVDPYGRVLARGELFETRAITHEVRLLSGLTFYGHIGDFLAYLCLVLTIGWVFVAMRVRI
tara:strand:- start:6620 stop:8152 length:1533 start_codon:yes stop_codon:yes gene_type:complete